MSRANLLGNLPPRLTDYEKYMLALARQRRMATKKNDNVIPFPKQDQCDIMPQCKSYRNITTKI